MFVFACRQPVRIILFGEGPLGLAARFEQTLGFYVNAVGPADAATVPASSEPDPPNRAISNVSRPVFAPGMIFRKPI